MSYIVGRIPFVKDSKKFIIFMTDFHQNKKCKYQVITIKEGTQRLKTSPSWDMGGCDGKVLYKTS